MDIVMIIVIGIILVCLVSLVVPHVTFAPWVPCADKDLDRIFSLANLKPGETFYDLGCGNGKTVFAAAERGARAIGIELGIPLFMVCWMRQTFRSRQNVRFIYGDILRYNLRDADVIYVYGTTHPVMVKLAEKLRREAKPGCRVISYTFPIPGREATKIDKPRSEDLPIYLYESGSIKK